MSRTKGPSRLTARDKRRKPVQAGTTPLDHTSILKTVQQRRNLPSLTARDAAAPGFADVLTLATARTDDPLADVTVPTSAGQGPAAGEPSHLQEIQAELISRRFPAGVEHPPGVTAAVPATAVGYENYIRVNSTIQGIP